ncbi:hypothetical protein Bbelb_191600 [Branchiostoma belcheri]|nr:hypothetical protein Bbelb_191600 [Branchiostoma belcheri]
MAHGVAVGKNCVAWRRLRLLLQVCPEGHLFGLGEICDDSSANSCSLGFSEDSCLNLTREDWIRPDDLETADEYKTSSSDDSCLNLARKDWTRLDDLKTQEEYQVFLDLNLNILTSPDPSPVNRYASLVRWLLTDAVVGTQSVNLTREDWTRSGDLETQEQDDNNIHRPDEGKPVDLKTQSEEVVQVCPDVPILYWEKPVMMAEFYPNLTGSLEDWKEGPDFD